MAQAEPKNPNWADRIRETFARQPMMAHLGLEITELSPGACALTAPIRPEVTQHHGFAHAGLAFAAGDNAAGMAASSLMAADEGVLTIEMKINLLAPATGKVLIARGRVIRAGRTITTVGADVFTREDPADPAGERHVATLLGAMAVLQGRP